MAWCLLGKPADKFLQMLRSGQIDPLKLANMSSAGRHAFFAKTLGKENAAKVNAAFERKLLLPNQKLGIQNWAKQMVSMKPEVRRDILSRVQKMERYLQPEEAKLFLNDLVEQRLGMSVSLAEADNLAKLSKAVTEKKSLMKEDFTFPTEAERLAYGRARVGFSNYANDLKVKAGKMTPKELAKQPGKVAVKIAGIAKAAKASMDNSGLFRQGWKPLWTHPGLWRKNAVQSFRDIWNTFGKDVVMDELNADIVSRPNSLNGKYKTMKLDIGTIEEAFPTSLPEKVPVLGKFYKASENAYTAFLHRLRADLADLYLGIAEKSGVDIASKSELVPLGKFVNAFTGRGHLGKFEPIAGAVNNIFFSGRLMKGNLDFLTAHQFQKGVTPFVRKQAAINLLKNISGMAAIAVISNAVKPGSVEWDSRSADFGKIRIGSTRFDFTGGMASYATLAMRLARNSYKSSVTGKVKILGEGYKVRTRKDMLYNFFENKFSPAVGFLKTMAEGRTFEGKKPTALGELQNLFEPIILSTERELRKEEDSANYILSILADALGISVSTYKSRRPVRGRD